MHELMKKTCEALEDIEHSGSFNVMDTADRRIVSELVDLKKNILKVQKLEDEMEGYSEDGMDYGRGSSYADRGMNRNRGGMGRGYSSRRNSKGRYSRDDGREEMIEHVKMAIETAPEEYKGDIKRFLREIEG